jgi:hypothetical protein
MIDDSLHHHHSDHQGEFNYILWVQYYIIAFFCIFIAAMIKTVRESYDDVKFVPMIIIDLMEAMSFFHSCHFGVDSQFTYSTTYIQYYFYYKKIL